jgi:hypothetical protein
MTRESGLPNLLSFKFEADVEGYNIFEPVIDGIAFSELVKTFELSQGYNDPAGGYGGIPVEFTHIGDRELYYRGQIDRESSLKLDPLYLLGCECTVVDCWPLMGHIYSYKNWYIWSDFSNPFRLKREYALLAPFYFQRNAYENALKELVCLCNRGKQ